MQKVTIISINEARKKLGADFDCYSDDDIEELIIVMQQIARYAVYDAGSKNTL